MGSCNGQRERVLMLAVLHDAVSLLMLGPEGRYRLFADARDWVSSDDVLWPFSFLNICEALDLGPERLRARLAPSIRNWAA
jgi:hypothetical protein